ncbi:universal stress protein [Streptosporangiaceae bacterium NEAU-GS5]|nr:universal stress protein [Streptosporangiaceae bacterium NEAU-GS5]
MSRPIVIGVDGSDTASAAVRWAAADAGRHETPLKIVHVREPWASEHPFTATPGHERWLIERGRAILDEAARLARAEAPEIEISTALAVGAVPLCLIDESLTADSLVLGSRGLGGFSGLVLGSVGLLVAGKAEGPVVIIRGFDAVPHGQVAVGYDGSVAAEEAMAYALEQASARGARLRVVYAWHEPTFEPFVPYVPYGRIMHAVFENEAAGIGERLAPWRDKYPDVEMEYAPVAGHPVQAVAEASRDSDLVVVGSRGLGKFGAAVLGSVSHGVLHHASCTVAVVRPREKGESR